MRTQTLASLMFVVLAGAVGTARSATTGCDGPAHTEEAHPQAVQAFVKRTNKRVLTLAGYSGAGYEDPKAMLAAVARALAGRNPSEWILNIGGTAVGIGAAYELAKQSGFTTMGVVSSLARDERVELAKCVDRVFFVPDTVWGGRLASGQLSPTSVAMVETGSEFLAIGGGEVTRDEMLAARRAGKPVRFVPADMNHEVARQRAARKSLPVPTDFKGEADAALRAPGP